MRNIYKNITLSEAVDYVTILTGLINYFRKKKQLNVEFIFCKILILDTKWMLSNLHYRYKDFSFICFKNQNIHKNN